MVWWDGFPRTLAEGGSLMNRTDQIATMARKTLTTLSPTVPASDARRVTRRAWVLGTAGVASVVGAWALTACEQAASPGVAPTLAPGQPTQTPGPPRLSAGQTL